jgi:predicted amidohydrolase YtcJ
MDPPLWLQSQVTRTDPQGHVWGANQRISVAEAVRCGTINGAYSMFEEHLKGSIQPGRLADLVVWDQDMFEVEPSELSRINPERTMIGGRWAYEA